MEERVDKLESPKIKSYLQRIIVLMRLKARGGKGNIWTKPCDKGWLRNIYKELKFDNNKVNTVITKADKKFENKKT